MSDRLRRARLLRAAIGQDGPLEPVSADWPLWVSLATTERVVPSLLEAARATQDLTKDQREQVRAMQLDVAVAMVRIEQDLVDVADLLNQEGVAFAALKGNATAHLDYGDPSERQFGDVDLLIDPSDMPHVRDVLARHGWAQAHPLPRHHERFTHAVTLFGRGMAEIDLHQHVGHRALGMLIPTSELLADRVPYDIAGRQLWALCALDRLIHSSIHAVASRGQYRRLSSIADVLLLSLRLEEMASEVLDRAEGWRVRPLVEAALRNAWSAALLPLPEPWAAGMRRPVHERARLVERSYMGARRRPISEELAFLQHMSSWGDRALYVYGHLWMDSGPGPGAGGLVPRVRYLRSRLRQRS